MQNDTQRKITLMWLFSKLAKTLTFWRRKHSTNNHAERLSTAYRLYRTCHELPLVKFEDCLCDDNINSLIISGNPPLAEVQKAWLSIYNESIDLSDAIDVKASKDLQRKIIALKLRLLKIETTVKQLYGWCDMPMWIQENKEVKEVFIALVAILRSLNFRFKFEYNNVKQYKKDLEMVITRSKPWAMDLALKEKEYEAYLAKQTGEKPDRIYFTQTLVRMVPYFHTRFDKNIITVAEFFTYKKEYVEYCEQLKKQKHGR